MPGPDAEALVLLRPGDGTAGTLQRSASAGVLLSNLPCAIDGLVRMRLQAVAATAFYLRFPSGC